MKGVLRLFFKGGGQTQEGKYRCSHFNGCRLPDANGHVGKGTKRFFKLQKSMVRHWRKKPMLVGKQTARPLGRFALPAVVLAAVLTISLVWALLVPFVQSIEFFKVSRLLVKGRQFVTSEDVLRDATGIKLHKTSMFEVDSERIESAVRLVPWVKGATLHRTWPSTVELVITENTPVALVHNGDGQGDSLQYLDENGTTVAAVSPGWDMDYPVVSGLSSIEEDSVRKRALHEVLKFLKRVRSNNPYLPSQSVSQIQVRQNGELILYLVEYPFPIYLGNRYTSRKHRQLVRVLGELYKKDQGRELIASVKYIQMEYQNMRDKVLVAEK